MNEPLISVIVPVYKVEKYLDECVESIVDQTYRNLEIILVDDGSPDNCPQMCDDWAKKDERIYVIHKENGGLSSARNAGLDRCKGEYVTFVDSDDWINLSFIQVLLNALLEVQADMAACCMTSVFEKDGARTYEIADNGKNAVLTNEEGLDNLFRFPSTFNICACGKIIRKSVFFDLRFKEGVLHEDEFMAHHLWGACHKTICLKQPLYYYRQTRGSITKSKYSEKRLDGVCAVIERIKYAETKFKRRYSELFLNLFSKLEVGYYYLGNEKNCCRLKKLKKAYNQEWRISFGMLHTKDKVKSTLFLLFPRLYTKLFTKQDGE